MHSLHHNPILDRYYVNFIQSVSPPLALLSHMFPCWIGRVATLEIENMQLEVAKELNNET